MQSRFLLTEVHVLIKNCIFTGIYLLSELTDKKQQRRVIMNYCDYHCTSYCIRDIILPKQIIALIYGLPVDIINVLF